VDGWWRETGIKDQEHDEKAAWPFSTEEIWLAMGRRSLIRSHRRAKLSSDTTMSLLLSFQTQPVLLLVVA
jgi:hypothetical protein